MALNDYEAENLAAHIQRGSEMAQRSAMQLIGYVIRDTGLVERMIQAEISSDGVTIDLNLMPELDRAYFARFATYGAMRLELAIMRHQQRNVDAGGDLKTKQEMLADLIAELETLW